MRTLRTSSVALAAALSLTLAACGGSDDEGGEDTAAPAAEEPSFEAGTPMAEIAEVAGADQREVEPEVTAVRG